MRISYNWLKDYIDIKIPPERLAQTLTMAGLAVDSVKKIGNDHVLEIEVTANRPDWLSHLGIARELAALTGKKLKAPKIARIIPRLRSPRFARDFAGQEGQGSSGVSVRIEDKKLCPRYTARIIRNVKVGESPAWLKTKIEAMGLRPVNNIVDITNFCLFETGEPMHAFDLDRLEGKVFAVRKSKSPERITTIDGIVRTLDNETLVIADSLRPVAIAGVMGGVNTGVTGSTKNILLEAAYFDPISVRRTSRKLALASESSYRFERKVDIANIPYSSDRALGLILELAGGEAGEFIDIGGKIGTKKSISLRPSRLRSMLGIEIPIQKVRSILTALGLKIKSSSKEHIKVEVPSFRHDLNAGIDLIEEISRIYGYDKIPGTIPKIVEQPVRESFEAIVDKLIRQSLVGLGCDEIITYSLLSKNVIKASSMADECVIEIKNPLSIEQEAMRPNLAAGMLNSVLWNINRKAGDLKLFELGNIYIKTENAEFAEKKHLAIGIAGEISGWAQGSRPYGFFDLKGIVETLFSELRIEDVSYKFEPDDLFSPSCCASVYLDGEKVGVLGTASRKVLNNFDIKEEVYFCEICVDLILKHAKLKKRFSEPAKYPSVFRDISIVVEKGALSGEIAMLIKNTGSPVLKEARLIDRYAGKQIPSGKIGLTYRLEYQDLKKTLEEKDVLDVHAKVLRALEEKLGARLR
ncbi:MAG: phenylalanine--tRNA ligase subunit beta [Candidatus Omnitrophota bacterium]|nr:phenylalanine--tRNA ligase subunit beta [Candidatus Omnitrophota bacterium]